MRPECHCPCGQLLDMRDVRSKRRIDEGGPWSMWSRAFRCSRCGKRVVMRFEVREDLDATPSSEVYERSRAAQLGEIRPDEANLVLDELERELATGL